MADWDDLARGAIERARDGEARAGDLLGDDRQRQLTRIGNASWAAGLALLGGGHRDDASEWLVRSAAWYRRSYAEAPPGSWGRPIAALKALLLADEWAAARGAAEWALGEGAADAESPIGRYAAVLALLVLGRAAEAEPLAATLRGRDDFPGDVAGALEAISAGDEDAYGRAVRAVLASFEQREEFLEDIPLADTVLVLQLLAGATGLATPRLESALLPSRR